MRLEDMTPEMVEKTKNFETAEEWLAFFKENGVELTDEQLEYISGGHSSTPGQVQKRGASALCLGWPGRPERPGLPMALDSTVVRGRRWRTGWHERVRLGNHAARYGSRFAHSGAERVRLGKKSRSSAHALRLTCARPRPRPAGEVPGRDCRLPVTVKRLRSDLSTTCKWMSIDKKAVNAGANPIDVLDKLVSMKFNWDTQGYYARAAFRTEATTTIEEAWAIVSTFYNATDPSVASKYQPELDNVGAALQQIALRPAGQSPEEVRQLNQAGKEINVYSPSLGYAIKQSRYVTSGYAFGDPGKLDSKNSAISRKEQIVTEAQMTTYRDRLYEGDIWEDPKFAGLEVGDPNQSEEYKHMFGNAGIAFHQDVATEERMGGGVGGGMWRTYYRSWVRGIRPDKSITSEEVMKYQVNSLYSGGPEDIRIFAHFIWFDRR